MKHLVLVLLLCIPLLGLPQSSKKSSSTAKKTTKNTTASKKKKKKATTAQYKNSTKKPSSVQAKPTIQAHSTPQQAITAEKKTPSTQTPKTEKNSSQNLRYIPNNLDVIYAENDFEEDEDLALLEEDEVDEGTENEADILYAGFDTSAIHYPKFDFSQKQDTTFLFLTSKKRGDVYVHPCKGLTTSYFGPRGRRYHYGIDVNLNTGDPVVSAFHGTVRIAKFNKTYGNLVVVRHENGLETFYAHLSAIDVEAGDVVKAGQQIGLGGNTGRSRGSHLHFEVRYLGAAINPEYVIDFHKYCLISDTLALTKEFFKHQSSYEKKLLASSSNKTKYYKIKKGDTLASIAKKNRTTVKQLCKLNKISPKKPIQAGKKIRVS